MERRIRRRDAILTTVTQFSTVINKPDKLSVSKLKSYLNKLDDLWSEFCAIEAELPEDTDSCLEEFNELFIDTQSKFNEVLDAKTPKVKPAASEESPSHTRDAFKQFLEQQRLFMQGLTEQNASQIENMSLSNTMLVKETSVSLPKINIEPFSGEYCNWPSFFDLYNSTVHFKTNLPDVHKFQILKGLLRGNASELLEGMNITDNNYHLAYEKLTQRYNKMKPILNTLVSSFFNQPSASDGNVAALRKLADCTDKILNSMKSLGADANKRDPWLIHLLLQKIDVKTQEAWSLKMVENDFPTVEELLKFLSIHCDAKESLIFESNRKPSKSAHVKSFVINEETSSRDSCSYCDSRHTLSRCFKFRRLPVITRRNLANEYQICYNCMKSDHLILNCNSTQTCRLCQQRHHTLLHLDNRTTSNNNTASPASNTPLTASQDIQQPKIQSSSTSSPSSSTLVLHSNVDIVSSVDHNSANPENTLVHSNNSIAQSVQDANLNGEMSTPCLNTIVSLQTILPTALVYVNDKHGQKHVARVLLDSASTASFINESLVQRLGIRRSSCNKAISGIADTAAGTSKGQVSVTLHSQYNSANCVTINALILNKITSIIPSEATAIQPDNDPILKSLSLADPSFHLPSKINILLGAERVFNCFTGEKISVDQNVSAVPTLFGWVIGGELPRHGIRSHCAINAEEDDLNATLKRFWQLEDVPLHYEYNHPDIESLFKSNVQRLSDGRYSVKLPLLINTPKLGDSRKAALMRLFTMERRFSRDPVLKVLYEKFMNEYLRLGHMELVPRSALNKPDHDVYYLPHHSVIKADSTSTKLRVVFDGSCQSSSGVALNDKLMTGPTIQSDLYTILARFRKHSIVYAADIEKMYRQVLIHDEDRDFQRVLWRNDPAEPVKTYRLNTVTYGTTSAPYLAIRTLHQIIEDSPSLEPNIRDKIKHDFYVDDFLSGSETLDDANTTIKLVSQTLAGGKFPLRKWRSNSREVLVNIPEDLREKDSLKFSDYSATPIKTLGLSWDPVKDIFLFRINLKDIATLTKRTFLSNIAKIFDPIGWLAPVTVSMKIMFQKLWLEDIEWDDELSCSFSAEWEKLRLQLVHLESIQIPRHYMLTPSTRNVQLHAFCDASTVAYGAVAYFRVEDEAGNIHIRIISAKTRVAPLPKKNKEIITLPKLELCGALLLANLIETLQKIMEMENLQIRAWCDSQIVLAWLACSNYNRWKPFVANRTTRICSILPIKHWSYVRSQDNPADAASRGLSPSSLRTSDIWWNGPNWLRLPETEWPQCKYDQNVPGVEFEKRKSTKILTHHSHLNNDTIESIIRRWSTFIKVKAVIAAILLLSPTKRTMHLVDRLRLAEIICIRHVQQQEFSSEINSLETHGKIDSKSKLIALTPYLDNDSVLRVSGRIQESNLSEDEKHPVILPRGHYLSNMIIRDAHLANLHPGPSLLTSILRQKYWILDCRNMTRNLVRKCMKCFRLQSTTRTQLMGNLPSFRVTPGRPFLNTGVDYAGPIQIKARHGRGNIPTTKGYIALFICLATKAVHLELVSEMTTNAYLAALRRFISRRGIPIQILSDNGTNFVGAKNEMKQLFHFFTQENQKLISNFLSLQEIKFAFIPARAAHFGGIWESNIKSMKSHLSRVTNAMMTFEDMATLLTQIEAILNSRPLCPISEDVYDLNVLTPGHFLIGAALTIIPEPNYEAIPVSRLSRWQHIQSRVQAFWRKWSLEYLNSVQQRAKWSQDQVNLSVGDLVIVKEDNVPPTQWIYARIIEVHPGSDGRVRVATIRTKSGEMKRPIVKLQRLPIENDNEPIL